MHFPFFVLPFDHRSGLARDILQSTYPFSEADLSKAKDFKKLVFEAILQVRDSYTGTGALGALFDEETALDIIEEAKKIGLPITVSMEKSGTKTLALIHGDDFGTRLEALRPTFGKILVHYQPNELPENAEQLAIMTKVSAWCETNGVPLMLEVLLDKPKGHTPEDMIQVFTEIQAAGVKVGLWKIEGFDNSEAWKQIAPHAKAPMIILGRGQNASAVATWVEAAAKSGVVDGFAIGRTIFQDALSAYNEGAINRAEAIRQIAANFQHFIQLWEKHQTKA
jgi:myo-inositol catabolism protein IolC